MPRILRTRLAELDLDEIWLFIAEDNPRFADRVLDKIGQSCKKLARFPGMGRHRPELAPHMRSHPVGNYVIFYQPMDDGIEIIRILHGARDIHRTFRR